MWCVRLAPAITAFSSLTAIAYAATTSEGPDFFAAEDFVGILEEFPPAEVH
jgi:hypothetical protein